MFNPADEHRPACELTEHEWSVARYVVGLLGVYRWEKCWKCGRSRYELDR